MPSRAYTSFLLKAEIRRACVDYPVSMPSRAYTSFLPERNDYEIRYKEGCVNALSGLYLISTRYVL